MTAHQAPPPPLPARPTVEPRAGDLVHYRRERTKGKKVTVDDGYAIICWIARGDASLWPVAGPITRRLNVDPATLTVLIPAQALIDELDRRALEEGIR